MGEVISMFDREVPQPVAGMPAEPVDGFTPIEEASLRALGRRALSRRELERTLGAKGYDEEAVAREVERLERTGLIDDYALAQHLVAHLQERKGMGAGAIKAELVRRVIAPGAIEYALDLIDTADELSVARALAAKRIRQYRGLDQRTIERRLTGFLMRRGYSSATVRAAVATATTP